MFLVCRDDKKGDGKCDEINNRAECHYDSGDCCKKEWIGDGKCDERNRFVTCNNDGLRYKSDQTHDGNDFVCQAACFTIIFFFLPDHMKRAARSNSDQFVTLTT